MDTVYVVTKLKPQENSKEEMLLEQPSFIEEVEACHRKKGASPMLGSNYLRAIAAEIGKRYDKMFNPYRNVVPQDYVGIICNSSEEIANIVHLMFQARYPQIYQSYYEYIIKSRKIGVKIIYFHGLPEHEEVFKKLGIPKIEENQISDYLGKKVNAVKKVEQEKIIDEPKLTTKEMEKPKEVEQKTTKEPKETLIATYKKEAVPVKPSLNANLQKQNNSKTKHSNNKTFNKK